MLFSGKICQLRKEKQLLQRQVSAALEIDNALYCKIERGDRSAKREQVVLIAKALSADENELLTLWLADRVMEVLDDEKELVVKALDIVNEEIK